MNEKILILGGSYFVGKKITVVLSKQGYDVTILNRGTKPCPAASIEQLICDRNDAAHMKSTLMDKHFDYIIDVSWNDLSWVKILCDSVNFDTVKSFIFLSSSSVYDIEHLDIPFHENDSLAENKYWTTYGKGKIEAENYYENFLADKNTNLIILRPPYIYGEDNYAQRESFIFKQICDGLPIVIPGTNPKLQFIYSEDLAYIIVALLKQDNKKTAIYNVGNKQYVTAYEWVQACAKAAQKEVQVLICDYLSLNKQIRDFFPFFDYDNVLDVERINKIYDIETPFEIGLKNAYDWFNENKSQIKFKDNVENNLYEIIAALNK